MSFDSDTPEDPHDVAVDWILRKKESPLTRKEQAALDAWLAVDTAHMAAYREAEKLAAELSNLYLPSRAKPQRATRKRRPLAAAMTFGVTAALLALFFDDFSAFLRSDHFTGTGETRSVTLEDGSRIEIGPRSAIALHFTPKNRRLTLLRGEAWFDVAPDPGRSFVVEAAGGTITALGTSFDIAADQTQARVTVTAHHVVVASGGKDVIAQEGQETSFVRGSPARAPAPANVARLTAWRRGKLIVEDEALANVLTALGRYHHGFISCSRPRVCARRVSGVYSTDDPLLALEEIETSLGLTALRLSDFVIVLHD